MNVKLKKSFQFLTGLVYDDEFSINAYDITLHMTTMSLSAEDQNTAYERMHYWINEVLANSVLIDNSSKKLEAYKETGQRVISFPAEPVDQIVGAVLCLKLNAIVEDRMIITQVDLASSYGDDVVYQHYAGEEIGPLAGTGWCTDSRPCWADTKKRKSVNKVISINRMPEWADLGLAWEEQLEHPTTNNTVVYADFPKNENK